MPAHLIDISGIPRAYVLSALFEVADARLDDEGPTRADGLNFQEAGWLATDARAFDSVHGRSLGIRFVPGDLLDARAYDARSGSGLPLAARIVEHLRSELDGAREFGARFTELSARSAARTALMELLPVQAWRLGVARGWSAPASAVLEVRSKLHYADLRHAQVELLVADLRCAYETMTNAWVAADDQARLRRYPFPTAFEAMIDFYRPDPLAVTRRDLVDGMLEHIVSFTRGYFGGVSRREAEAVWLTLPAALEADFASRFASVALAQARASGRAVS